MLWTTGTHRPLTLGLSLTRAELHQLRGKCQGFSVMRHRSAETGGRSVARWAGDKDGGILCLAQSPSWASCFRQFGGKQDLVVTGTPHEVSLTRACRFAQNKKTCPAPTSAPRAQETDNIGTNSCCNQNGGPVLASQIPGSTSKSACQNR